jgi:small subunit ribosomal protein S4e
MSKHLKRLAAPTTWPVPRKTSIWVAKPSPGPHPLYMSIPLVTIVRDMGDYCDTSKEARRIIGRRKIHVDGKPATDYKWPVGLMDVISIPETKEQFRLLLDRRGKFRLMRISAEEAGWKLVRIENKTTVKGGKTQLNLHDGRNIVLNKNARNTGDTLKIEVPSQKIIAVYELREGMMVYLTGGMHIGQFATVQEIEVTRNPKPNLVRFTDGFSTIMDYVFPVGEKTPEITLPEVKII